jgi:pyruvate/2-oxoglutarate dehydrogenase complex dihydrolipoamide dehydrogenase (E3) component
VHDGIALHEGVKVTGVAADGATNGAGVAVTVERDGRQERIAGSHLLVATGRRPNLDGLNLDAAGIAHTPQGITVDAGLRTSNKKVYAVGDVAGGAQFTHLAGYHASVVLRSALFRLPAKADTTALPWVTYSDPELAHVGLGEDAARERHGTIRILRWSFAENDRAQATRQVDGMIKVITAKRGRVLGASIVGPEAGELIQPWILAVAEAMPIRKMAQLIAPYPTLGEVGKRAAGSYYAPSLFSERTRSIVRLLGKFG